MNKSRKIIWITLSIIILLFGILLVWRLWPRSLADILSVDSSEYTHIVCNASVSSVEDGEPSIESYQLQTLEPDMEEFDVVLEILNHTKYCPEYRNLLPWPITSVESGDLYEGMSVNVLLVWGDSSTENAYISFLSKDCVAVSIATEEGYQVFHPTDTEALDELATYIKLHNTAE